MKIISIAILSLFIVHLASAQTTSGQYDKQIQKAFSLYEAKDYKTSAETYDAAFKANHNIGKTDDRYNAACSWALAGNADNALANLQIIVADGTYDNYSHITTDTDLKSLYVDKRWQPLIADVKHNQEKAEAKLNKPLTAELKQVYTDDQGDRRQLESVDKQYGRDSKEIKALWDTIAKKDADNIIKVTNILDRHGWLGADSVGKMGELTLFLVIQHADLKVQEKYLPGMREAVKKGNANPANLALLEDRVAMGEGKKQIYGSQIGRDMKTGKYYVNPIEDEPNVNKRRASVGLPPLEDYAKNWGIDYHLPGK
jgi:hypothetical protein